MASFKRLFARTTSDARRPFNVIQSVAEDIRELRRSDWAALFQALWTVVGVVLGVPVNDRQLLLEHLVVTINRLPKTNRIRNTIADRFIGVSWFLENSHVEAGRKRS